MTSSNLKAQQVSPIKRKFTHKQHTIMFQNNMMAIKYDKILEPQCAN